MYAEPGTLLENARQKFVTRVYSILSIQLTCTFLAVLLNTYSTTFAYVQRTYMSLFWLSFLVSVGGMLTLALSKTISRTFPINIAVLGAFTLAESYLVSAYCSQYTPESIVLAAAATMCATLGITLYAFTFKTEFEKVEHQLYGFASALILASFVVGLINIFFIRNQFISSLMAIVLAAVYSIYLLYDTRKIIGGKHKELNMDDSVKGAMLLYMDIISLFLQIMKLLGEKKKD